MKRYSILHPLYLSFFSRDLYRDVRTNWKGTGFLYLLLLLAVTWLPVMYKIHGELSEEIRKEVPKYLQEMPKITIVHGRVSIDRPVPYTIPEPDDSAPFMVIDTSGTITSIEQTKATVLLTVDKIIFRKPHGAETRIYDLSGIDAFEIDRERVDRWVQAVRRYFAIVAYPVVLAASFGYRMLQMVIYAAIGMLFVSRTKAPIDYAVVLRIASVAITPVVVISTLLLLAGIHVPASPIVFFAVAMGYLYFAVKANAGPETPERHAP